MSRKSRDLDKKLIDVGVRLVKKIGVSKISFREVARLSNVNLGMLNYHFKNKDEFLSLVLEQIYGPFVFDLEKIASEEKGLEDFLFKLAVFSRNNRKLILMILKEVADKDSMIGKFAKKNMQRHIQLLSNEINNYLVKNKITKISNPQALRLVVGIIGMPNIILGVMESLKINESEDSDEDLLLRVRAAVAALSVYKA